jgi:hypothetical protein
MQFKEPFVLGPFSVDADGRLSPTHKDVLPGFNVRWRGRSVHARLARSDAHEAGRLFLQSSLGRIPSTASDPEIRVACFAVLRGMAAELPEAWTVRLLPDHQPQLEVEAAVALPITVTNLVTELVSFLLEASPFYDLMDQAGAGLIAGD